METEAKILEGVANTFDETLTKVTHQGTCYTCNTRTANGDMFCKKCGLQALRDMAKHLRQYL